MNQLNKQNERPVIDYMARDYVSLLESMREQIPTKLPEWTDNESEADFGNVLLQLIAHMGDILSYYQDRVVNESFLSTAQTRRSIIEHLRLIGYRLATATPASTTLSIQFLPNFNDVVQISRGDAFATKSFKDKPSVRFEYLGPDVLIDSSTLPVNPQSEKKEYPIPVEQGKLVREDIIGISDGRSDQRLQLSFPGLILRSIGASSEVNQDIAIQTELGGIVDGDWRLQESLAFSRVGQKDFAIEIDELDRATVMFGNERFGAIIPSGAVIRAMYRIGGGIAGNVPSNTINTIIEAPALSLAGARVTNRDPATGGSERENIEHAVQHAPNVFRSLKRAVTHEDYEALALSFNGVGKVRAVRGNWNTVNLFVAPEGGGRVSDILRANLIAFFEDKRPVSTSIEIKDVDYVKIYVSATVGLESYYAQTEMKEKIEEAARQLLAFENVDFGEVIFLSKVYEALEAIAGVHFVNVTEYRREGDVSSSIRSDGRIELGVNEIPRIPGTSVQDPEADTDYANGLILTLEGGY